MLNILKAITLSILFAGSAQAQSSISFSPTSFIAWGTTPSIGSVSFEYSYFGVHYFHNWTEINYHHEESNQRGSTRSAAGLSLIPLQTDYFRAGVIVFDKDFPVNIASRLNFLIDIGYSFGSVRFSYRHISNGFGLINNINPGLDNVVMTIRI